MFYTVQALLKAQGLDQSLNDYIRGCWFLDNGQTKKSIQLLAPIQCSRPSLEHWLEIMRALAHFEDHISALQVMNRIVPEPADKNELKVITETKLEILIKNRKIRQAWLMTRKINCAIDRELSLGRLLKSVVEDRNLQEWLFTVQGPKL